MFIPFLLFNWMNHIANLGMCIYVTVNGLTGALLAFAAIGCVVSVCGSGSRVRCRSSTGARAHTVLPWLAARLICHRDRTSTRLR